VSARTRAPVAGLWNALCTATWRRRASCRQTNGIFADAGEVLRRLRAAGRDVRRASLVHDVLIALTARTIGARLVTADAGDFEAIRALRRFSLQVVPPVA
jgi:predicted nucleic acid-binding protein